MKKKRPNKKRTNWIFNMSKTKYSFDHILGEDVIVFLKNTGITQVESIDTVSSGTALRGYILDYDEKFIYIGTSQGDSFNVMVAIDEIGVIQIATGMVDEIDISDYDGKETH